MYPLPLISVYMPTHNRVDRVERAIDSVLRQSYENFELIVVDDGSTDGTDIILNNYQQNNENFSHYRLNSPRGACVARNLAINKSTGKFIAGIDDDDEWHPDRLLELLNAYEPSYSCVFSEDELLRRDGVRVELKKKSLVTLTDLLYQNEIGNQVLTETDRLRALKGFDESLVAAQDYDMWLRLVQVYGDAKCVHKPLQTMYVDAEGRITRSAKKISGYLTFYRKHKYLMSTSQKKFHYLIVYYMKNKRPSFIRALYFLGFVKLKRRIGFLLGVFYSNKHGLY